MNDEKALILAAQQGHVESLSTLLQLHYSHLRRYIMKITLDPYLTDDLIQDTMLKAMIKIKSYKEISSFSSWLITIATRLYIDVLRKKKREQTYIQEQQKREGTLHWQLSEQGKEKAAYVVHALSQLSVDTRVIVILKYVYGYPYLDIAKVMNIPEGTVKSRIHYGIQVLRKEMACNDNEAKSD